MLKKLIGLIMTVFLLSSCLGLNINIHIKKNGSGRIVLEYQIPASLENLGRLDGNKSWPIIPIGKADFERTLSRIEGIKLASYSSVSKSGEYNIKAVLDFKSLDALAEFLGANAKISGNTLEITLNNSITSPIDSDLLELIKQASAGKKVSLSFKKDGSVSSLKMLNEDGASIPVSDKTKITEGNNVSFSINTSDIFDFDEGLVLKISWN